MDRQTCLFLKNMTITSTNALQKTCTITEEFPKIYIHSLDANNTHMNSYSVT